jgi:hypothetical protein
MTGFPLNGAAASIRDESVAVEVLSLSVRCSLIEPDDEHLTSAVRFVTEDHLLNLMPTKNCNRLCCITLLALSASPLIAQENMLPVSRTAAILTASLPKDKTTLLALPMRSIVASGAVSAISGADLTLDSSPVVLPAVMTTPHAIKITSRVNQRGTGANAPAGSSTNAYGLSAKITAATGQIVTAALSTAPNVGDEFVIYPMQTIASLFGAANTVGLTAAATPDQADIIYLDSAGSLTGYFYNNAANAWRLVSAPSGADQGAVEIAPTAAVMVARKNLGTDTISMLMSGSLLPGKQVAVVSTGFQVINNPFTVGTTLAASGLRSQVTGGTAAAQADVIYLEDAGVLTGYYYKTGGLGGIGWRSIADPVTNQGAVVIAPGKAFLFKEQAGTSGFAFQEPFAE